MYAILMYVVLAVSPGEAPKGVEFAYKNSGAPYREAIPRAYQEADPEGNHPEWEVELWRICHRESWCGKWGTPKIHNKDGWAGSQVWAANVLKGRLNPRTCAEHRLQDYRPVRRAVRRLVKRHRWSEKRANKLLAILDELPEGERFPAMFSTQGGFGMMAAGNVRRLGECVAPEALRDPYNGAKAALHVFQTCERWDGEPGERFKRPCTCAEHVKFWMGAGIWLKRSHAKRRRAVVNQCGGAPPLTLAQRWEDFDGWTFVSLAISWPYVIAKRFTSILRNTA